MPSKKCFPDPVYCIAPQPVASAQVNEVNWGVGMGTADLGQAEKWELLKQFVPGKVVV